MKTALLKSWDNSNIFTMLRTWVLHNSFMKQLFPMVDQGSSMTCRAKNASSLSVNYSCASGVATGFAVLWNMATFTALAG